MAGLKLIVLLILIKISVQQDDSTCHSDNEEWICGCGDMTDDDDDLTKATEETHYPTETDDQTTETDHYTTKTDDGTTTTTTSTTKDKDTGKLCKCKGTVKDKSTNFGGKSLGTFRNIGDGISNIKNIHKTITHLSTLEKEYENILNHVPFGDKVDFDNTGMEKAKDVLSILREKRQVTIIPTTDFSTVPLGNFSIPDTSTILPPGSTINFNGINEAITELVTDFPDPENFTTVEFNTPASISVFNEVINISTPSTTSSTIISKIDTTTVSNDNKKPFGYQDLLEPKTKTENALIPIIETETEDYRYVWFGNNETIVSGESWTVVNNGTTTPSIVQTTATLGDLEKGPVTFATVVESTKNTTDVTRFSRKYTHYTNIDWLTTTQVITTNEPKTKVNRIKPIAESTKDYKTEWYHKDGIKASADKWMGGDNKITVPTTEETTRKYIEDKSTTHDDNEGFLSNVRENIMEKVEDVKEFIVEKKERIVDVKDKIADKINIFRWFG